MKPLLVPPRELRSASNRSIDMGFHRPAAPLTRRKDSARIARSGFQRQKSEPNYLVDSLLRLRLLRSNQDSPDPASRLWSGSHFINAEFSVRYERQQRISPHDSPTLPQRNGLLVANCAVPSASRATPEPHSHEGSHKLQQDLVLQRVIDVGARSITRAQNVRRVAG